MKNDGVRQQGAPPDGPVELMQVVITNLTVRGQGIKGDPARKIREVWDLLGNKIAEFDPWEKP